jgi:DNA-binding SARP family transcriptional activator
MDDKVTYHQQVSYCGKPRCRRCREGIGHGPYWYAYKVVNGRTVRTYIGKELPPQIRAPLDSSRETSLLPTQTDDLAQTMIRIYTLGQFRLERRSGTEWQPVTDATWQHQRVRSVLGCLISSQHRKLGREQLIDAIWPELEMETAAGRLDRAVYSLRQVFEPSRDRPATSPLLLTEREVVALANQDRIWIDVSAFEQLLNQARSSSDPDTKQRLLEKAAALYGGDFLPEERKVELALTRREFLQRSWVGLQLELADLRAAHDLNSAIEPLDRILASDPTNEAAVQRLMKLLTQLDRRGEALRVYKRLAAILQQEYHIAPLSETRMLYDAVRHGVQERLNAGGAGKVRTATGMPTAANQDDRREASLTGQIGRTHQSPLVGRERELATLRGLLATAEQATKFKLPGQKKAPTLLREARSNPQTVLLMGDVGIGKTRLAEEIAREARRRGWAITWNRVYPQEASMPYRLWTEILRKAIDLGTWQRQEVSKSPMLYQPLITLLPEISDLLPQVTQSTAQSAEQEQLRLWEATRELLTIISESTPLLIVLDDVQWSDSSSCELLAYLARRVFGLSIVIVGTCRESELDSQHPLRALLADLQHERVVEALPLQPLSDEQIGEIISHRPHLPHPLIQYIQSRAAGNPFFAEELARTMEVASTSQQSTTSHNTSALPDTISAALNLRLSRLSSACQRLLSKAAVLGSSFEFHHISAMEARTPGYSEDIVLDLVEEALQAGMLTEEGTGTRITYQFWHPLLVAHLYDGLSAARRANFHRRVAEILRQEYQGHEEEGAAAITHHLVRGGDSPQQIAHYAELAGNRAYTLSAYPDAEHYYRLAADHLERALRQTSAPSPDEQLHLAYLLEFLGESSRLQGKEEEARRVYEQALLVRNQCRVAPSPSLTETTPLTSEEAQLQAMLWCEISLTWYDIGDNTQARRNCERAEQVLLTAGVTSGMAWARLHTQQGYIDWREGNYDKARQHAQEALALLKEALEQRVNRAQPSAKALARQTRIRRILAGDPVELARIQLLLGSIAIGAGQGTQAIKHWNDALNLFEQYDCRREIAIVACNLGDVHLRRAEYSQAQVFLRRSLGIAERTGYLPLQCVIFGNLGVLAARTGYLTEAENWYHKSLELAAHINDQISVSILCAYLAQTLQDQGKLRESRHTLARALSVSRSIGVSPCIGFALVAAGEVRLVQAMQLARHAENGASLSPLQARLLARARKSLTHALMIEGMEAETRTEGQLALAQVELLLGEMDNAKQRTLQALDDASHFELYWLIARAQRILGSILTAQSFQSFQQHEQQESHERYRQAIQYFEQALHTLRTCGMRLEQARTLHTYGLTQLNQGCALRAQALQHLYEAHQFFVDCHAVLEAQTIEHLLTENE